MEKYICSVCYNNFDDKGKERTIKETHVVKAASCTDAETALLLHFAQNSYPLQVLSIKDANVRRVQDCLSDLQKGDWYLVKIEYTEINDVTGKDKKSYARDLLKCTDIDRALKQAKAHHESMMIDWQIVQVSKTNIMDFIVSLIA